VRGILVKTLREVWLATLLFGVGLLLVEMLLNIVLPQIQEGISTVMLQMPFVQTMLSALLGVDVEGQMSAQIMQSIVWVHPVILALLWAHEILFCTRTPAAEIDRGTIDILLGLPISRRALFLGESATWLCSGAFLHAMVLAGYAIGARAMAPEHRPEFAHVCLVLLNLLCVYVAVGGVAWLASAMSDRRGSAIAVVFALVLASFLLNFLGRFWPPAERFAFLGVLEYYQPADVLIRGVLPPRDALALLGFGLVTWLGAGEVFARRSICTT